jgi:hypothetical protein
MDRLIIYFDIIEIEYSIDHEMAIERQLCPELLFDLWKIVIGYSGLKRND